jgi:hypothetical protein
MRSLRNGEPGGGLEPHRARYAGTPTCINAKKGLSDMKIITTGDRCIKLSARLRRVRRTRRLGKVRIGIVVK